MATAQDLIADALTDLGVLDPIEAIQAKDAQYALRTLNRMLEAWNTEYGMIYSTNLITFNLLPGKQSYTIGIGGDVNVIRPTQIKQASIVLQYAPYPIELPLDLLLDEEWQGITVKATPSSFPTKMWIEGNYPLNVLWMWPVPQDVNQVKLYVWNKDEDMTLTSQVLFPNGYEEAIVSNLAVWLAPGYNKTPSPILLQRAQIAKDRLSNFNSEPMMACSDDALLSNAASSNAIRTFGRLIDRT
jgi:hypothetical protein